MKSEHATPPHVDISAIVLAGGASMRMGCDKAWLRHGGCSLLQLAMEKTRAAGVADVSISGRAGTDYSEFGCTVLLDTLPGNGPLGGIESGLKACRAGLLLVLAVDMPQMTSGFLRKLISACDSHTGVVPESSHGLQPLSAIYPVRCHGMAAGLMEARKYSARGFAQACLEQGMLKLLKTDSTESRCLENWNSPDDVTSSQQP